MKSIILSFLFLGVLAAQTGKISGLITGSESNQPLVGVSVLVEGTGNGADTDQSGRYVILNVAVGEYSLRTSYIGYASVKVTNLQVSTGRTTEQNFILTQEAINAEEIMGAAVPNSRFRVIDPSLYPPESAYYNFAGGDLYNQNDVQKAQEYLKKANYNGEPITFQSIATNPLQVRVGVALVSQLKKAGMNAELKSLDLQTWVANRRNGDALMMYHSGGNWIDPSLYQPEFNGTFPSTETAFSNSEVDDILRCKKIILSDENNKEWEIFVKNNKLEIKPFKK